MHVYCRVPVGEFGSRKVIKTRWVDTNKGDERSPDAHFFASTPILEAVTFLISEAMTSRGSICETIVR